MQGVELVRVLPRKQNGFREATMLKRAGGPKTFIRQLLIPRVCNRDRMSGRRRRPLKGSPPSATQTERAVFPHSAFMNGFARSGEKGSVRQGYLVHQRVDLLLLTFERQMIG